MGATLMFRKCAVAMFSLLIFLPGATALAYEDGLVQKIQNRLDHKGDVIDQRLDQKGSQANQPAIAGTSAALGRIVLI